MSGSPSGTYFGPSNGGNTDEVDCYALIERVYIESPIPVIVAGIEKGNTLVVVLDESESPRLLAKTLAGQVAGSLIPTKMTRFIKCIAKGVSYLAIVLEKSKGAVLVEIRPAS